MSTVPALTASGPRELKRARPIPARVRRCIELMVYGRADDEDCAPLSFIEAAKLVGIAPDQMRRYLDRADVRALLLATRRKFREMICCANEAALQRVRDKSPNGMVTVAAVRALEQLETESDARPAGNSAPGLTIHIVQRADRPAPPVDVTPAPATAVPYVEHPGPNQCGVLRVSKPIGQPRDAEPCFKPPGYGE
jgi:hypothetical protein